MKIKIGLTALIIAIASGLLIILWQPEWTALLKT